jgi:hypothetical protein
MAKSFALALAALVLSAGAALASPSSAPVAGNVPQQNGTRTAQVIHTPVTQAGGESHSLPGFSDRASIPLTASVPATLAPVPLRDSTLSLVNETGGGD